MERSSPFSSASCSAFRSRQLLTQASEEYIAAIDARDEFLSVASHELKTPLTSLLLLLQIMERNLHAIAGRPAEQLVDSLHKSLGRAISQANRLTRLVDELLDVSRVRAGRLEVQLSDLDLGDLLRTQVDRFQEHLRSGGIEVELSAEPGVVVRGDQARLEQVAGNLIANAVKYGKGNPIEIHVWKEAGLACFSVRDHGMGIAASDQERIFDRFERAHSPRHIGGLGLGLYISRVNLRAMGGTIGIESELDRGSTFTVRLPLTTAPS